MQISEQPAFRFKVFDQIYEIPRKNVQEFPLQDAYVNVLVRKYLAGDKSLKLDEDGAILINLPFEPEDLALLDKNNLGEVSCTKHNFAKLVEIYANPKITMFELLNLQQVLDVAELAEESVFQSKEVLEGLPAYNMLRKTTYRNFLQELDFYGVLSLFQTKSLLEECDLRAMKKRFNANLPRFFSGNRVSSPKTEAKTFVSKILALGGVFSGSAVLNAVVGEIWRDFAPKDLDVFVHVGLLREKFRADLLNDRTREFCEDARKLEAKVRKLAVARKEDPEAAVQKLKLFPHHSSLAVQQLEKELVKTEPKKMATYLKIYLQADEVQVACSEVAESYSFKPDILYVLKCQKDQLKFDIVVINATMPYFMEHNFDFDFCNVYYDGYNVNALNWDALRDRHSPERTHARLGSEWQDNLSRITKYFKRGFVITTDDTKAYRVDKRIKELDDERDAFPHRGYY